MVTLPRPRMVVDVHRATLVGWTPIRVPYRRPPVGAPKLWMADSRPAVLSRLKLAAAEPSARCHTATSLGSAIPCRIMSVINLKCSSASSRCWLAAEDSSVGSDGDAQVVSPPEGDSQRSTRGCLHHRARPLNTRRTAAEPATPLEGVCSLWTK